MNDIKKTYYSRFKCLVCGHSEVLHFDSKEEFQEVTVCPKCNGAFVDKFKIGKYINETKPSKLNITVSVKDTEIFIELVNLLKEVCDSETIPNNIKELIQTRIGYLIAASSLND